MLTFTEWLLLQQGATSAIGDLANDVSEDPCWPANENTYKAFERYLNHHGAEWRVMVTLEDAWSEYQRESRRKPR